MIRLLETLHEERIRYGITAETSVEGLAEALGEEAEVSEEAGEDLHEYSDAPAPLLPVRFSSSASDP